MTHAIADAFSCLVKALDDSRPHAKADNLEIATAIDALIAARLGAKPANVAKTLARVEEKREYEPPFDPLYIEGQI